MHSSHTFSEEKVAAIMANINNTPSSQALIKESDTDSYKQMRSSPTGSGLNTPIFVTSSASDLTKDKNKDDVKAGKISKGQWFAMAILTFINLINYMDRYTIAGILRDVQEHYNIGDAEAGALQTVFVVSYMVVAPVFGYLGDRHSRRWLMVVGVSIWSLAVLIGSFIDQFGWFLFFRALVGIGEASYSTIAPTLISDMFVKEARSKCLAIFYFAIPVGSGLGYVVGQQLANAFGGWQWALRGTPILGVIAVLLIIFLLEDPPRGGLEGQGHSEAVSYEDDLKSLMSNGTFVLSTLGFTCVTFCTGSLAWWGPKFLQSAIYKREIDVEDRPIAVDSVSFVFGVITMVAGIFGVILGATLSTVLKRRYARADPLICGAGLAVCCILFTFALYLFVEINIWVCLLMIFLGEVAINLNWSIVADILLYVVAPNRRGTAEAVQILVSHLFGDAGSPYLIGLVSEHLKGCLSKQQYCSYLKNPDTVISIGIGEETRCGTAIEFYSMQYAMGITLMVVAIGALFFFICSLFVIKDKLALERGLAKSEESADSQEVQAMLTAKDMEEADYTDEDNPPTINVSVPPQSQERNSISRYSHLSSANESNVLSLNKQADKLYTEIKTNVLTPSFSRLLDSDTSLNTSVSDSSHQNSSINSQKSDAEIIHELVISASTTKQTSNRGVIDNTVNE